LNNLASCVDSNGIKEEIWSFYDQAESRKDIKENNEQAAIA